MTTTMRGQDVWIGLPYDLFFYTVLHELVAGWLGAELGEFHHQVGSLHIYESHLDDAEQLTSLNASEIMPDLSTPWDGFDGLLRNVQTGELTGHPGWDTMTETMHSYRLWKGNLRDEAWQQAGRVGGPLGLALTSWYSELNRRAASSSARPVAGVR